MKEQGWFGGEEVDVGARTNGMSERRRRWRR